ncbi:MAG: hypothetical protein K1W34_15235 [Lachnospiraceae bacterium]
MYSFDVFDTLITRTTAEPRGIFLLMKEQLRESGKQSGMDEYVIDNFLELRVHSEALARLSNSRLKKEEVTLYEIYMAMALCGCINEEQIKFLCLLEQETEVGNAVGLTENIQRVKTLLAQGERVVLISDMYLPCGTIRRMLVKVDDIFEDMPLYVSSEYCKRKTTGNLYRQVQKLENVSYEDWTHIGDNIYQDMEVPYGLGIKVELCQKAELSGLEKTALEMFTEDSRMQHVIGSGLLAEREYHNREGILSDAYHIGCRYAAPVLYSYVEWMIDQAVKKGITRLYFIARDGYLLKRIADIILEVKGLDIQTSYVYSSRKAWRMPSLSNEYYNLYQLILWSHTYRMKELDDLAEVLHITLDELYRYLPGTYAKQKKDRSITDQEVEYIARKLSSSQEFKRFHLEKLRDERELVLQYLEQEIDVSDEHFAFVDVAGGGLTQGCLRELLKVRYQKPIHTFFFKVDKVNLVENSKTDTFFPSFLENSIVMEMLCRAPHGQTKRYAREDGRIVPVLEETEEDLLIKHGFYEYEKGITDFTWQACKRLEGRKKRSGTVKSVLLYLRHIAQEPPKEVLEYFASMPSSETGRGKMPEEYAPKLSEHDIKEIFLKRTCEPLVFFYNGTNLNYSVMRATEEEKALIERCKREHGSALGRLYRQDEERRRQELCRRYGRAAFYPTRLLEEKIILYGAGKFGRDLYDRLWTEGEHKVVLWVDKAASFYQQEGMEEVHDISQIKMYPDTQIIIAVMAEDVAYKIRCELIQLGVESEYIEWICPYQYPYPMGNWEWDKIS